jgi:protocatechuate 3,4-dioxygenase beta subunit
MKKTFANSVLPLAFLITFVCTSPASGVEFQTNFSASISGTIRDASGAPAAGVLVSLYSAGIMPGFAEVKTDSRGRYDIIPVYANAYDGPINPKNTIVARDLKRNLAAIEEFIGASNNIDLTLLPAITISGSVKDVQGQPVNNAELDFGFLTSKDEAHFNSQSYIPFEVKPVKADGMGVFSISALPQGCDYYINDIKAEGYGSGRARVEAKNTQTNHYEFPTLVLKKADKILAGNVIGPDGQPVAGADIDFYGAGQQEWPRTKSDDKGHFIFESVCEGEVQLSAYANFGNHLGHDDYEPANSGVLIKVNAGDTNILIVFRNIDYPTPLMEAARFDEKDRGASLLANGASVNVKDSEGKTPLHWAAVNGFKDMVVMLLTNNADVMAKDMHGVTPLHEAAIKGDAGIMKLLLANGAGVNVKANNGFTPLHWAALYGRKDAAELLLINKADVNAQNNAGKTPLYWARQNGRNDVAQLLREHGGQE